MYNMFEKLDEIRKKHPVAFWIACVVLLPLGLIIAVALIFRKPKVTDVQLLEDSAKNTGKSEAHNEHADDAAKDAAKEVDEIRRKNQKLQGVMANIVKREKKYKEKIKEVQKADDWDSLDKLAAKKEDSNQ